MKTMGKVKFCVKKVIKKLRGGGIKTQSINDQTDRPTDKTQVEIAIKMSKHLDMPNQRLKPKKYVFY